MRGKMIMRWRVSMRKKIIRMMRRGEFVIESRRVRWLVDANSKELKYYVGHPYTEEDILPKFADFCKRISPRYFIDVGANFGFYSVLIPQQIKSIKHVSCFEPLNKIRDVLRVNIALNRMGDMKVRHNNRSDIWLASRKLNIHQ